MLLNGEGAPRISAGVPAVPGWVNGVSGILKPGSLNVGVAVLAPFIPLLSRPNVIAAFCFSSWDSKVGAVLVSVFADPGFSIPSMTPSIDAAFQASNVSS